MKRTIRVASICVLWLLLLTSCASPTEKAKQFLENTPLPTLTDQLAITDKIAQDWDKNAFMTLSSISFGWSDTSEFQVFYESPSKPYSALWVYTDDGNFVQKTTATKMDPRNAISPGDWRIGSDEAFEIALAQQDVIEFAAKHAWKICGYLNLMRNTTIKDHPVQWQIQIEYCQNPIKSVVVYLDPLAGKRLDNSNPDAGNN